MAHIVITVNVHDETEVEDVVSALEDVRDAGSRNITWETEVGHE